MYYRYNVLDLVSGKPLAVFRGLVLRCYEGYASDRHGSKEFCAFSFTGWDLRLLRSIDRPAVCEKLLARMLDLSLGRR